MLKTAEGATLRQAGTFRRLWASRFLVWTLTRRAFQIRYRQSFAGYLWAIIPPLGMLAVGSLVFGQVAGLEAKKGSYALGTLAAVIPWNLFANSVSTGIPILYSSSNMITRLAFPRAALPLSVISQSLVSVAITCVLFLAFAIGGGDGVPITAAWFPLLLAAEIILIAGVVLLGSAIDVFARDMRLAVPFVVQLWLLLTPVMYPLPSPDSVPYWYELNPMTGFVESFRAILVYGEAPDIALLMPSLIGAAVLFLMGSWYFTATEPRFADVV
ncbi:MAG: ABC transporter permease [Actinomycetota bacterium]